MVIEPAKVTESIPAVGEVVYAIGSPRGLKNSISQGIVSGLRQDGGRQLIQTTAPISPGSSGGGLFDKNSKLVGITTLRVGQAGEALNFSIPFESFQRLEDANMAAEEIASVFKRFFRGAEASIALTQQNEFSRWLYEPQQKKVRDYFAQGMVNEAIAAGTDLDQLRKVFTQAQGTAKEVLDNYRADQKQAVAEAGAQESEGKTTLVCVIKNVGTYTLILDSVNKTVNGRPAAFTDTRIEFGDDVAQLVLDRYASTLTFTNRSGSAQADCRRPDKRAF